jgi:hypothetical protein
LAKISDIVVFMTGLIWLFYLQIGNCHNKYCNLLVMLAAELEYVSAMTKMSNIF